MKIRILAVLFLVFVLSVIVAADMGVLAGPIRALYDFPNGDKLGHFCIYGLLAFLLAGAFPRPWQWGRLSVPIVTLALLIFSASEEYSQRFFPVRTADIWDLLCSWSGILLGTWLALRWKNIKIHDAAQD